MKKFIKIFSLFMVLAFAITVTSCTVAKNYDEQNKSLPTLSEAEITDLENTPKFIGYIYWNEEEPSSAVIYRHYTDVSAELKDKVVAIFSKDSDKSGDTYSLPKLASGLSVGTNFKGWFVKDSDNNVTRVTSVADLESNGIVYAEYIGYGESGLVVLVCMIIVFLMLALLWLIVSLFRYFAPKEEEHDETESVVPVVETRQPLKLEDITDDDMMAAALVASIDYHNEIKEDVRVVSIKEIK